VKQDFHINLDFNDTEDITFEVKLYEVVDRNGSVNVGSEINNTFVAIQGTTLVWSNISNNSMVMRVIATDSSGASSDWQPIVLLCHCLNGGSCSYEKMVSNNASGKNQFQFFVLHMLVMIANMCSTRFILQSILQLREQIFRRKLRNFSL
jgi:hypothetical protein